MTDTGIVAAGYMIVAAHFPLVNKHGSYFLEMYQYRSYAIVLEHGSDLEGVYVDAAPAGPSLRNHKDLLLVGGGGCRAGKTGGNWEELGRLTSDHHPDVRECCRWSAQDCTTFDRIPYIGWYSKRTRGLLVIAGFNRWGTTSPMVFVMVLADMVMGRKSPYEAVFSPSGTMLRPQLAANGLEAVKNLLTLPTLRCPHIGYALK